MSISERVKNIIKHYDLSVRAFEKSINASNNSINTTIKRGSDIKSNTINKILQRYPGINPTWLLTGKGDMLREDYMLEAPNKIGYKSGYTSSKHSTVALERVGLRLDEIIKKIGTTADVLADKLGVSYDQFMLMMNGNLAVPEDLLDKIEVLYPQIDRLWLHTGKGNMLKDVVPVNLWQDPNIKPIPLVTHQAAAGFGSGTFTIAEQDVKEYYVIPKFKHSQVDFMIEVRGNSMYPKYNSGDIIACKILKESNFIQPNKPHLIGTKEQGMLVKRILEDKEDCLVLKSDNKEYPNFEVPKEEITGIAVVIGVIRLE